MQTIGFTDNDTAVLSVVFSLGLAVGMVAGGIVEDTSAKHLPRCGRPSVNQLSIAVTAPLVAVFFKALPGLPSLFPSTLTCAGPTSLRNCGKHHPFVSSLMLRATLLVTFCSEAARLICCFLRAPACYHDIA